MNILAIQKSKSDADTIARHLCTRMYYGKVVIVVDSPKTFISALRKKWFSLIRKAQIERARTLDAVKIADLNNQVNFMIRLHFTTHYPPDEYPGNVYLVSPEEALMWAPDCATLYIAGKIEVQKRHLLASLMPPRSLVVLYGQIK